MRLILCTLALAAGLAGPVLAADKLVPATAGGGLEPLRGQPWTTPLNNCAGFYTWNGRRLREAGDSKGSWDEAGKAAEFMTAAATRYSEDQSLTYDQGLEKAKPKIANAAKAMDFAIQGDGFIPDWIKACNDILAGYRKAVG